ncbi:hypothetical protein NCAST_20_02260 [Nocardia asteroides NBRC 15531]|uniref:Uncharacterized protein n=1 Tax=Nocardia asteroides NBRC 15531 TaxID=1110697 RepID=U5E448_NOCAS|nr:hypothetical protein NCAST_20_02260 [Nocardia asteroides NBRC 15531]
MDGGHGRGIGGGLATDQHIRLRILGGLRRGFSAGVAGSKTAGFKSPGFGYARATPFRR